MSTDLVMLMPGRNGMGWKYIAYHPRFRQILCSGALRLALRTTSTVHLIGYVKGTITEANCTIVGYFQEVKGSHCSGTR